MRSDQCHGEPKPAAEILPDTSKYDDLPNKLRALAKIMESGERPQIMTVIERRWLTASPTTPNIRVRSMMDGDEFRLKPKPRELWACFNERGILFATHVEQVNPLPGCTVVRFVEQPE